jgi:hypothetical protein
MTWRRRARRAAGRGRAERRAARLVASPPAASAVVTGFEPPGLDALVTVGGSGKRRRGWLVAAVLVVVLAGGALVAGRANDEATTAPPTTPAAASTSTAPATTRPPPTSAAPSTTSPAITNTGGPVLPEPTGESLYSINATGDLYRVDLDTGIVTHADIGRVFQNATVVALDDGAVVIEQFSNSDTGVDRETVMFRVRADGSVTPVSVPLPSAGRIGAPGVGAWLFGLPDPAGQSATLVTADGDRAVTLTVPPGAEGFVADGDGIAFRSASGTYRIDTDGIRRIATGELIALSDRFVVANECDAAFRCTVTRADRASGQVDTIGGRPDHLSPFYQPGRLSPDGRSVAVEVYAPSSAPTEQIYDLDTNTVHDISGADLIMTGPQAWTVSGWSAFSDNNSDLVFVRGAERRSFNLPGRRSSPLVLAVGPTPAGAPS